MNEALDRELARIDGKGYKAYKDIIGTYPMDDLTLKIDHVQGDPFAAPSKLSVVVPNEMPAWSWSNSERTRALCDFLGRTFHRAIRKHSKGSRGSGKGGDIAIDRPSQEILERTAVHVSGDAIEVRFRAGLPAFGRKIAGQQARAMLLEEVPAIVRNSLFSEAIDETALQTHVETCEDATTLRSMLRDQGWVAFVAEEAILPRRSGVDPRPLEDGVPFRSPETMRTSVELPNRTIQGMAIPTGITLITGGGYHGKSTLLSAIELGIYDHVPGDGREFVVSDPDAFKIRAEDGRSIVRTDISPFINDLPHGKDTRFFTSENASGSTSQAANTVEALETGARVMLVDEDTSATNFMIRDDRMQELVPKAREPITPYIDKARQLYNDQGVSTVLVIGGSGAYFDIADTVLCMVEYQPQELTERAKAIAEEHRNERKQEGGDHFGTIGERCPDPDSIDPSKGNKIKVQANGTDHIRFGRSDIDIQALEQLVHPSQARAIAEALVYAKKYMDGNSSIRSVVDRVMADIKKDSLDVLTPSKSGELAQFRREDLAGALNRLRGLRIH